MTTLPAAFAGYEHIRRYWDIRHHQCVAKILPGDYYVTRNAEVLMTVVGSCVTACIRDSKNHIGGMNHFMLPMRTLPIDKWENSIISAAARYGNFAMEHLINDILKHGGQRQHLEIKLFGGAQILQNIGKIGQQNIQFVRNYLQLEGLRLVAEDLGDIYPRKILFYPATGLVRVKKLRSVSQSIVEYENRYRNTLEKQNIGNDVDLFED